MVVKQLSGWLKSRLSGRMNRVIETSAASRAMTQAVRNAARWEGMMALESRTLLSVSFDAPSLNLLTTELAPQQTITIKRNDLVPSSAVTVDFQITPATNPTYGTDYTLAGYTTFNVGTLTGTVTMAPGQDHVNLALTPVDDAIPESNETVNIQLTGATGATLDPIPGNLTSKVTILDNDSTVSIQKLGDIAEGGVTTGVFRISRALTDPTTDPLKVYFTRSGSAALGGDFTVTTGADNLLNPVSATIAAGQQFVDVTVQVVDDLIAEGNETINLTLNSSPTYTVDIPNSSATMFVGDNEPSVSIAATTPNTGEGSIIPGTFRISRTGSTANALTVYLTRAGSAFLNADFTISGGGVNPANPTSAVIGAGQSFVDVQVTPLEDTIGEGNETVVLTLGASATYSIDPTPGADTATVNIADNEPVVSINQLADTAEGSPFPGIFRISRVGGDTSQALTVYLQRSGTAAAIGTADYTLTGGGIAPLNATTSTATIAAGADFVDIIVTANNDVVVEPTETVILTLLDSVPPLGSPPSYSVGTASATVNIADNEQQVSISKLNNASEAGILGGFRIARLGNTSAPLTVYFTRGGTALNAGNGDYTLSGNGVNSLNPISATIAAGADYVDINVTATNDLLGEGPESIELALAANPAYSIIVGSAGITIVDNEPTVRIDKILDTVEGGALPGAFRITRTGGDTSAALTVYVSRTGTATAWGTGDHYDYKLTGGGISPLTTTAVTIAAGADFVDITLNAVDDAIAEFDETAILTILAHPSYSINPAPGANTATVTIVDNEPDVRIQKIADASENGLQGTFRISRTGASTGSALTVYFSRSGTALNLGTGDYTLSGNGVNSGNPLSATIAAGQDYVDVTLTATDDNLAEGVETAILTLANNAMYSIDPAPGAATATVNIADNEAAVKIEKLLDTTEGNALPGVFRITRTGGDTSAALTVYVSRTGTALVGNDYALSGGGINALTTTQVTIAAGADFVDVVVTAVDDNVAELNETVTLTLLVHPNYSIDPAPGANTATVTIVDNEPDVRIDKLADASESGAPGTFRISRTGSSTNSTALWVYFTRSGTALNLGTGDYTLSGNAVNSANPLSATIAAGSDYVDVTLTATDDNLAEGTETAILTLLANANYSIDPTGNAATVNIVDNEATVKIAKLTDTTEGGIPGTFRLTRTGGDTSAALTVYVNRTGTALTTGTGDYTLSGGGVNALTTTAVTIAAGQDYVDVTLTATDDNVAEGSETAILTLLAHPTYTIDPTPGADTATLTIVDNEPVISIEALADASESGLPGVIRISRTGASTGSALTVYFSRSGTALNLGTGDYTLSGNGVNS
ncbi:MAG: Calx-beta domain-containing protein, partial [Phycisphaerae bacterium]